MSDLPEIRETIVVEGVHDAVKVREAVRCDVVVTHGFRLSAETIGLIRTAQRRCGVIVLTDPDGVGERIRRRIEQEVPGVKHCYIPKEDARDRRDIGIENATAESIRRALSACAARDQRAGAVISCGSDAPAGTAASAEAAPPVTMNDLFRLGLAGSSGSAALRARAGRALGLGEATTKRFLDRLNRYRISLRELEEVLRDE